MFQDFDEAKAFIQEQGVRMVDLKYTDLWGRWHHVTVPASQFTQELVEEGVGFDASSVGLKPLKSGDMVTVPDLSTGFMDPYWEAPTLSFLCSAREADSRKEFARDPRNIAMKAENYLLSTGIADTCFVGPEAEFFIFDDVRFSSDPYNTGFKLDSSELPSNMGTEYEMGNLGHRPRTKGGYFPVPPVDSCQDIRSEMLSVMAEMGVVVEKHHHEVAAAQHELGIKFGPMITMADHMQIYKYVIHQVAQA